LLWPPCVADADIIFLPCGFYLFSSPNLSGRRLDLYHTSTHGVLRANLKCMSEMRCTRIAENTGRKKSPFRHHRTILSGCIFAIKACIDNQEKNLLDSNTSSICPHNMVNFGPLTAEICWRVWGTPANVTGYRVLAVLLHGTLVVGVSQTLRRWTEGATYIRQGDHHVGHWPTFQLQ